LQRLRQFLKNGIFSRPWTIHSEPARLIGGWPKHRVLLHPTRANYEKPHTIPSAVPLGGILRGIGAATWSYFTQSEAHEKQSGEAMILLPASVFLFR